MLTKGSAITTNSATASGGDVVSWSVSPALPAGLSISSSSGAVTGTPSAVTAEDTYTVTASNSGGSDTTVLTLTVNDVAPVADAYTVASPEYTVGTAIAANLPSFSSGGDVVAYSVSPGLPDGLALDSSSGLVSGTPSSVTGVASYTVTATNSGGSDTFTLGITVNDGE
jgi:hypothetical protein